jgi:thiol-disulfide isomerase/thioredoxin
MCQPTRAAIWIVMACSLSVLCVLVQRGPLAADPGDNQAGEQGAEADHTDPTNPYLAPADLSLAELATFIEKMQRKPETIRTRPGFVEAIIEAADRILAAAAEDVDEPTRAAALLAKLQSLHLVATKGDQAADDSLFQLAADARDNPNEKIAQEARFHLLEQRAMAADKLPADELPGLIDELKAYFAEQPPTDRQLRLASATVRAVNLLPDAAARNKAFDELGASLAKSGDRKMAGYGKSVLKSDRSANLVGQPLAIEGLTLDGQPLDWASYRGKVVLVDFWATWCGPCIAELPNVRANYERYHDRGFEVVGISLDADRATLDAFLLQNPVPWVNLHDPAASEGWNNPNAVKYGVRAIPFPVLVDAQGNVVTLAARGEELGKQLEKLLGKQ